MFPLVPYLSGQPHPLGKRLVNVQRAGRFDVDLDELVNYLQVKLKKIDEITPLKN